MKQASNIMQSHKHHFKFNDVNWVVDEYSSNIDDTLPPLILLHGFPDCPATWQFQIPFFVAQGFRVFVPFLPGYGESTLEKDYYYPACFADDLPELFNQLKLDKVIFIGHDWGALAGQMLVGKAPERVICSIHSAIPHYTAMTKVDIKQPWRSRYIFRMQFPGATKAFSKNNFQRIEQLYNEWSPDKLFPAEHIDEVKQCLASGASLKNALSYYQSATKRALIDKSLVNLMNQVIDVPTLCIAGKNDGCMTYKCFNKQAAGYSGQFKMVMLDNAGHFNQLEQPELFNQHCLDFINSIIK